MTVRELREKFLAFFESKGHLRHPSGSLVPYDVTGRLDESLLFNGAGMIQFKPYFRGIAQPERKRLTTVQKCVRTGDIEEVGDATHLTFFEMLGNFSFGDYFKDEAIRFSWEFLTSPGWLALDPARLSFTVFESDDEAEREWRACGARHVVRLGEETNYWPAGAFSNGPPGPCGPNSEMFYWISPDPAPTGDYSRDDWLRDEGAGKWVEIWNDVFIQYDWQGTPKEGGKGYDKTGMPELPFRSIDTGMGLERTAFVLGGFASVYDTEGFQAIFRRIREVAGAANERAERIVADHMRTAVFCIADGILPGNAGRGYVLRRLLRRAILQGSRNLNIDQTFLGRIAESIVIEYGSVYKELNERYSLILSTLEMEEELFRRTLTQGETILSDILRRPHSTTLNNIVHAHNALVDLKRELTFASSNLGYYYDGNDGNGFYLLNSDQDYAKAIKDAHRKLVAAGGRYELPRGPYQTLHGEVAFKLYDTYGFPLEVTQEIAAESGIEVDVEGYERAMKEAQLRSRGASDMGGAYEGLAADEERTLPEAPAQTEFTGYERLNGEARIVRVKSRGDKALLALDRTPFYGESGGQVGDRGTLTYDGGDLRVAQTTKADGLHWHEIQNPPATDLLGWDVSAQVDAERRARIRRNHTATHLLQAALRRHLGTHVAQAGSTVAPDRLRFDFTHGKALTREEIDAIERDVNRMSLKGTEVVTYVDLPIAEARARGAMALFGEKYGDRVRMVEIGDDSRELCGGTHVARTSEIGLFRIVSESSAAAGVRRIEAVTGEAAYELAHEQSEILRRAGDLLKSSDILPAIERTLDALRDERRRRERAELAALSGGGTTTSETTVEVNGVALWRRDFGEADPAAVRATIDNVAQTHPNGVMLGATRTDDKIQFIAKAGPEAQARGAHAGNLLKAVAPLAGGGGGGRADFATAGGKDPGKVAEALAAAEEVLKGMVNP